MSSAADALLVVSRLLTAMNAAVELAGNTEKYRALVATAVAEGRDLNDDDIAELRSDAYDATNRIGGE